MKKLLFILSLMSLGGCEWVKDVAEYSTSTLASTITQSNFTKDQQDDLYFLLADIYHAKDCSDIQYYISENTTLHNLAFDFYLEKDFIYDGLLDFDLNNLLTNLSGLSKISSVTLSVITSWKQHRTLKDINYVITRIKKCYPQK